MNYRRTIVLVLLGGTLGISLLAYTSFFLADDMMLSDFGRDLVGAVEVNRGGVPFRPVGEMIPELIPRLPAAGANQTLVAHTFPSVALARAFVATVGGNVGRQEAVARLIALGGVLLEAGLVTLWLVRSGTSRLLAVTAGVLFVSSIVAVEDVRWIQHSSVLGLVLWVALIAGHQRPKSRLAAGLVGLLISLRPWQLPLAFAIPQEGKGVGVAARVLAWAALFSVAAVPLAGGVDAVDDWVRALMDNNASWSQWPANLSPLRLVPPGLGLAAYVVTVVAALVIVRWIPIRWRPPFAAGVVLVATPIVWPHYLAGLAPAFLFPAISGRTRSVEIGTIASLGLGTIAVALDIRGSGWTLGPVWLGTLFGALGVMIVFLTYTLLDRLSQSNALSTTHHLTKVPMEQGIPDSA